MLLRCNPLKNVDMAKQAVAQFYSNFALTGSVMITLGEEGLVYAADIKSPVKHIPAEPVETTDTTVSNYTTPIQ